MSDYEIATRARNHLWATFFLMGVVSSAWVPRIPEIKESLQMSDGRFGFVLLGSSVGAVFGAQLAGRAVHTFATKKIARVCSAIMPVGLFLMGSAVNALELVLGLFILGFAFAALDSPANVQGVAIEKIMKKRYMSSFHGAWSVGAFFASLVGGLIAHVVSPADNLKAVAIFSIAAMYFSINGLLGPELDGHKGEDDEETESKIPLFSRAVLPLWAMGIGLLASLIPESGIYDWSGILLKEHMNIGKGITAAAVTVYSLGMIVSRILGDKAFERWGHQKTVQYGGYISGVSLGASLLIGVPLSSSNSWAALVIVCIGFAITGLCMGPFFPAFNLAAMSVPGIAPSVGLARISVIAIAAYFAGPTVIGGLSELTSLPIAFAFPVALLLLVGRQARYIVVKEFM